MPKRSAGILLYRRPSGEPEVLLVHPGGPYWEKKDLGAWSIPKGEYDDAEDPRACALREFEEELGARPPEGELAALGRHARLPRGRPRRLVPVGRRPRAHQSRAGGLP